MNPFKLYLDPTDLKADGYPWLWHKGLEYVPGAESGTLSVRLAMRPVKEDEVVGDGPTEVPDPRLGFGVKDLVRDMTGHRCVRCFHPYRKGMHGRGEWTPCDEQCSHGGPGRMDGPGGEGGGNVWMHFPAGDWADQARVTMAAGLAVEAQWRILTVHHLTGVKHDLRWWNLVPLCQRCHLTIQGKVKMERVYPFEHTEWFRPYVAGYYAATYLGEEVSREEAEARLPELLALERLA